MDETRRDVDELRIELNVLARRTRLLQVSLLAALVCAFLIGANAQNTSNPTFKKVTAKALVISGPGKSAVEIWSTGLEVRDSTGKRRARLDVWDDEQSTRLYLWGPESESGQRLHLVADKSHLVISQVWHDPHRNEKRPFEVISRSGDSVALTSHPDGISQLRSDLNKAVDKSGAALGGLERFAEEFQTAIQEKVMADLKDDGIFRQELIKLLQDTTQSSAKPSDAAK